MSWLSVMWALLQLALWVFNEIQKRQLISQGHAEALKNLLDQSNALIAQIDADRKSALSGVVVSDEFNRDNEAKPDTKGDSVPVILPPVLQPDKGQSGDNSSGEKKQPNVDKSGV